MKKITFTLALMFSFVASIIAQPGTISDAKHSTNHSFHEKNGNTTLGLTYDTTACGLNYTQATSMITTRYNQYAISTFGYGFPDTLTLAGLPGNYSIAKAYVYFDESYTAACTTPVLSFRDPNGNPNNVNASLIGTSGPVCWGETGTYAFRADVTNYITGNGNYMIDSISCSTVWEVDGATLLVIYQDLSANYEGTFVIFDGCYVPPGGFGTASVTVGPFNVCQTPIYGRGFVISADFQDNIGPSHLTTINNVVDTFPNLFMNFDDTVVNLFAGQTSAVMGATDSVDCYLISAAGIYYRDTCTVCSLYFTVSMGALPIVCDTNYGEAYIASLSGGAPPYTYHWSTGGTNDSIHVTVAGNYSVTITDSLGNSGIYSVSVPYSLPNNNPQNLCIVTVDTITNKNMLIWDKTNNVGTASYNIYKETTFAGVYALLANQPFSTFSTFIDTTSQPMVVAARYKITTLDSCGVESDTTPHHKTIHLTVSQGVGNTWNLNWDAYEGITFPTYYILRGITQNNLAVLDSVQSTLYSYTDLNPPNGTVYYAIEMVGYTQCAPSIPREKSNSRSHSRSNVDIQLGNGIGEIELTDFSVNPNPTQGLLNITAGSGFNKNIHLSLINVLGQEMINQTWNPSSGRTTNLDIRNYSNGVYFLILQSEEKKLYIKIVKD